MPTHRSTTDLPWPPAGSRAAARLGASVAEDSPQRGHRPSEGTAPSSFGTILRSYRAPVERRLHDERVTLALLRAAVSAYSPSNRGVEQAHSSSIPGVRHSGTGGTQL